MELTTRDVQHLARLARLHSADGQAAGWLGPLEEMLAYVRTLPNVSIEVVEPPRDNLPVEYADEPHECLPSEEVLTNAPSHRGGWVTVAPPAGHMRAGHMRAAPMRATPMRATLCAVPDGRREPA